MEIGLLITAARKRAGYKTVYAMAKATGLSPGHIAELERGKFSPSLDTLERILAAIGWEVVVIFRPQKGVIFRPLKKEKKHDCND